MENGEGLEIILTPIQLSAIIENETIEESSSLSNRLWGAATLAGGAIELVGAGVLFLTPEPTTITKIAGGALGTHGLDTASTGIMQIVSGRTRTTMTSQAVAAAAEALGADPNTAATVGMAIDIAVFIDRGFRCCCSHPCHPAWRHQFGRQRSRRRPYIRTPCRQGPRRNFAARLAAQRKILSLQYSVPSKMLNVLLRKHFEQIRTQLRNGQKPQILVRQRPSHMTQVVSLARELFAVLENCKILPKGSCFT